MDSPRRSPRVQPSSLPSPRSWSRSELRDIVDQLHDARRVLERVTEIEWGRETEAWAAVALATTSRAAVAVGNLVDQVSKDLPPGGRARSGEEGGTA